MATAKKKRDCIGLMGLKTGDFVVVRSITIRGKKIAVDWRQKNTGSGRLCGHCGRELRGARIIFGGRGDNRELVHRICLGGWMGVEKHEGKWVGEYDVPPEGVDGKPKKKPYTIAYSTAFQRFVSETPANTIGPDMSYKEIYDSDYQIKKQAA